MYEAIADIRALTSFAKIPTTRKSGYTKGIMTERVISAVVCDFDGTLATCPYDFPHMQRAVLDAADDYGIHRQLLGDLGILETIDAGFHLLRQEPSRAGAFRAEAMKRLCALEYEAAGHTVLLPGIVDALQALRAAGFRLGIVTRNSTAAVDRIIGTTRLPVEARLCREDVPRPKPHPDHAHRMLGLLNHHPEQALMVGDHPTDIEMGKAAQMRTAAVLTGQSTAADLRAINPDYLMDSVVELTKALLAR